MSHPLGHLGVTYTLHLWLVGKPVVDFIFVLIELFSLSPTVETLWAEIGRSRRFSKGWVSLSEDFRGKGASPTNHCWCHVHIVCSSCNERYYHSCLELHLGYVLYLRRRRCGWEEIRRYRWGSRSYDEEVQEAADSYWAGSSHLGRTSATVDCTTIDVIINNETIRQSHWAVQGHSRSPIESSHMQLHIS